MAEVMLHGAVHAQLARVHIPFYYSVSNHGQLRTPSAAAPA